MTANRALDAGLEQVRAFLNTLDVEEGTDALATTSSMREWLVARGLPATAEVTDADRGQAVALREALRRLAEAHHDGATDPEAAATLSRVAADVPLAVTVDEAGAFALTPGGAGVRPALGVVLAAVYAADAAGTWPRLKVCSADDCRWAFYDRSKNRSRTWCSMEVCGNRAKARSYRARRQDGAPADDR